MFSVLQLINVVGPQFPALLHSILNRYPLIIVGHDLSVVDDLVESLSLLCPHRHKLIFWRDFTTEKELFAVWNEEKNNYEVARSVVCCLSRNLRLAIDRINSFFGWIIGVTMNISALGLTINEKALGKLKIVVASNSSNYGILRVQSLGNMTFQMAQPLPCGLTIEKHITSKILARQNQSIERIRRLLRKSIRETQISNTILDKLLHLNEESEKIAQDMLIEEVNGYVHAARRAVIILSRVRLVRELGAPTTITERSLHEAIGWSTGRLSDLIRFIRAEWHEDFSDCVNASTLVGLSSWVESMWGI